MAVTYKAISFAGCGFLGVYHMGVAQCLLNHGADKLKGVNKFAGASSGSIAAAVLAVCPEKIEECTSKFYNMAKVVRRQIFGAFTPGFDLMQLVREDLLSAMPADAHERATDRLFISMTHARTMRNVVVSQFATVEELVQCIICSCHIPGYGGLKLPVFTDGERYLDGGLTNNLPIFDGGGDSTILVSPFCGGQHVSPRDMARRRGRTLYANMANMEVRLSAANAVRAAHCLLPPPDPVLELYERAGRLHALRFLRRGRLPAARSPVISSVQQEDVACEEAAKLVEQSPNESACDTVTKTPCH